MSRRRFEFRLERVRSIRERAEDEAKEALAAAMAERARRADAVRGAAERLAGARSSRMGATSAGALVAHQVYVERAERELQACELELSRQDAEVDARRTALQHAARDRKVLETLKEQQAAAFRLAAERRENDLLDELALTRYARQAAAT